MEAESGLTQSAAASAAVAGGPACRNEDTELGRQRRLPPPKTVAEKFEPLLRLGSALQRLQPEIPELYFHGWSDVNLHPEQTVGAAIFHIVVDGDTHHVAV